MNGSDANHPDIVVGELTFVNGQRETDATHMALLTPPRRAKGDRRSETLLVFLDLGGGGASGLARAMLERFNRAYWRRSGPVTSALRHAIAAANAHLREENRLTPISHRRRGGLVCAVLRDDCVYVAQVGPTKAVLTQREQVQHYPPRSNDRLPLGVSSGIDVQFHHCYISGGERLLLTGESWSGELTDDVLEKALDAKEVEAVMSVLERQAGAKTFSALVVECVAPPPSPVPQSQSSQQPLPSVGAPTVSDVIEQEPSELAAEPRRAAEPMRKPRRRARLSQLAATSPVYSELTHIKPSAEPESLEEPRRKSEPSDGLSIGWDWLIKPLLVLGLGFARVIVALGRGARSALRYVLPEPEPRPGHATGRSAENVPLMAGIAVAIPVLIAFMVVTLYLQRGETERQGTITHKARDAFQMAQGATGDDARALWEAALQAAHEALTVAPDDEELLAIRDQARSHLDALDYVLRPEFVPLWEYGAGQGRRLSTTRMQVYVLDTALDQVTQHTLNHSDVRVSGEEPSLIAFRDETVADEKIGELRDILWLSAGDAWTSDALLILTEDSRLLQNNLSWGLSWVPFDTETNPANVRILRPFDGKVYALDTEQDQVWRFRYDGNGFGPPEAYFRVPVPDLSSAIDMTIDGAVYILLADGQIYKFFGGQPEPYQLSNVPYDLARPVALVSEGDMESGAIYVADADAQAIVALNKNGEFIHQIKADGDALINLEALAVEEDSRTLFLLANGRLYAVALPPVPEPVDAAE